MITEDEVKKTWCITEVGPNYNYIYLLLVYLRGAYPRVEFCLVKSIDICRPIGTFTYYTIYANTVHKPRVRRLIRKSIYSYERGWNNCIVCMNTKEGE